MKELAERVYLARMERANNAAARSQTVMKMRNDTNQLRKRFQDEMRQIHLETERRAKQMSEKRAQYNQARIKDTAELMKTIREKMAEIANDIKEDAQRTRNMMQYAKDQRMIHHEELMSDIKNDLKRQRDEIEANRNAVQQTLAKYAKERAEGRAAWAQLTTTLPNAPFVSNTAPKTQFSITIPFSKPE
ncbi:MAG: hypothetical protein HY22_01775 [[Candidatus Thermochlorobacteriaceae] bacterium GBChlB]|nr:MAG: hypothetical protein HY22_01775 [[Candidatus Thermochlorobacteriaceae] bacterium GBChlB]